VVVNSLPDQVDDEAFEVEAAMKSDLQLWIRIWQAQLIATSR
jgi:hypothetical protein